MSWTFSPSQIFPYYPKYDYLNSVMSVTRTKTLNLYVDVKGCAQGIYQTWGMNYILEQTKVLSETDSKIDITLFSSILDFVAFHKRWAKKFDIDLNMYFFFETGKSAYHHAIYDKYKDNRKISPIDCLEVSAADKKTLEQVIQTNYLVIERVLNKLPKVSCIKLEGLEADFVPYYLLKYVFDENRRNNETHIIYSADKDLYQCIMNDKVFQYLRLFKIHKMLGQTSLINSWLKTESLSHIKNQSDWFTIVLSIIGDVSDDFKGVKGIGPKTLEKNLDKIIEYFNNDPSQMIKKIQNKEQLFGDDCSSDKFLNKLKDNNDILERNMKLASFELLSDLVYNKQGNYISEVDGIIRNYVDDSVVKIPNSSVLTDVLARHRFESMVNEQSVVDLF